jgi:hypothetical protein
MCSLSIYFWFRHFATRVHVEHTLTNAVCCGVHQARAQTCSATKWTPRELGMETVATIVWTSRIWSAMMSEFCSHLSMSPVFFVVVSFFLSVIFCHYFINHLIMLGTCFVTRVVTSCYWTIIKHIIWYQAGTDAVPICGTGMGQCWQGKLWFFNYCDNRNYSYQWHSCFLKC